MVIRWYFIYFPELHVKNNFKKHKMIKDIEWKSFSVCLRSSKFTSQGCFKLWLTMLSHNTLITRNFIIKLHLQGCNWLKADCLLFQHYLRKYLAWVKDKRSLKQDLETFLTDKSCGRLFFVQILYTGMTIGFLFSQN